MLSLPAHKCAHPGVCPVSFICGWQRFLMDITGHLQRGSLSVTNARDHLLKEEVCLYNPK